MDVSIIICSRNGSGRIQSTLQSLSALEINSDLDVEIILVDNASSDDTYEVMCSYAHSQANVRSLQQDVPGKSRALNTAVKHSRGSVLLFSDDDVQFPSGWIQQMTTDIIKNGVKCTIGGVVLDHNLIRDWMNRQHISLLGDTTKLDLQTHHYLFGANFGIEKSTLLEIGGFDENLGPGGDSLGAGEDSLVLYELRRSGLPIKAIDNCNVIHYPSKSLLKTESFRRKAMQRGKSEAYISYYFHNNRWNTIILSFGLLYSAFWLLVFRSRTRIHYKTSEGISINEFHGLRKYYRIKQHIMYNLRNHKQPIL